MTVLRLASGNLALLGVGGRVAGLPLRVVPTTPPPDLADSPSALMPELTELRGLDQVAVVRRLHEAVHRVVGGRSLDPGDAAQLYALSARVERPLHSDSCAAFRALVRRCCEWRAAAAGPRDPALPRLNILIVLAGAYFGQDEALASVWQAEQEEEDEEGMEWGEGA